MKPLERLYRASRRFQGPVSSSGSILIVGIVLAVASLALFAIMVEDLLSNELTIFDNLVSSIIQSWRSEQLTQVMVFITALGKGPEVVMIGTLAVVWFYVKHRSVWESLSIIVSTAGGGLLNWVLKSVFQRARPDISRLIEVGGYSFPSGHATLSFTLYGMLGYLAWRNLRHRPVWRLAVLVVTVIFMLALGISRIYLGVHYPSDVVAGFASGSFWLISCVMALHVVEGYMNRN